MFQMRVPDTGKIAQTEEEFTTAILEDPILDFHENGMHTITGESRALFIPMNDAILADYTREKIDWARITKYARKLDGTVPKYETSFWWGSAKVGLMTRISAPESVIAFMGVNNRLAIAQTSGLPKQYYAWLKQDPDASVRQAASNH